LRGLWPLLALAFAIWSDARVLRAGKVAHSELLLAGERPTGLSGLGVLGRYGMLRPPWTTWVISRYALLRRTAPVANPGYIDQVILTLAAETRDRLAATNTAAAWRGVGFHGLVRPGEGGWLRR